MLVIALTGSIGMGKTSAAKRFMARGIPVFDADAEVHALYAGEAAAAIEAAFPGVTAKGKVDRAALGALLRESAGALARLEAIVHPLVRARRRAFLGDHARRKTEMVVLEIPLLFETGADMDADVTIVVTAPEEVQRARLLGREGMDEAKLELLLANQMPDAEKRKRADYVVDTNRPPEETAAEIDKLIESLRGGGGEVFSPE
ncbi:MAG TPA: dephospho-CoA kinase [Rhizobiales bacterium]|nr:dephospho-CoA kinase [bacterium BMS3Bbin10]HDO51659.1 dephospho-CoA kinase [Hyphomicrobiales bacterium]